MVVVRLIICAGFIAFAGANPLGQCKGRYEVFEECGSPCAPTCIDPNPVCVVETQCVSGCFCERGYIRNHDGKCAKSCDHHDRDRDHRDRGHYDRDRDHDRDHDHDRGHHKKHYDRKKCGPNEEFKKCKHTCEPTCKHSKPRECTDPCIDHGCQCRKGFVRDKDDDCVPKDMCHDKKYCGKNERWSNDSCVQAIECQKRCENHKPNSDCPLYCTNGGCVCKEGYVRTHDHKCVKPKDCDEHDHHDCDDDDDDCHHDDDDDDCGKRGRKCHDDDDDDDDDCHKYGRGCDDDDDDDDDDCYHKSKKQCNKSKRCYYSDGDCKSKRKD